MSLEEFIPIQICCRLFVNCVATYLQGVLRFAFHGKQSHKGLKLRIPKNVTCPVYFRYLDQGTREARLVVSSKPNSSHQSNPDRVEDPFTL